MLGRRDQDVARSTERGSTEKEAVGSRSAPKQGILYENGILAVPWNGSPNGSCRNARSGTIAS